MVDSVVTFIFVLALLFWLLASLLVSTLYFTGNTDVQIERKELIEECERDLPRTETCVLIAIPEKEVT